MTDVNDVNAMTNVNEVNANLPLYIDSRLTDRVLVPMIQVGAGIESVLLRAIREKLEGHCGPVGYVKPNSVALLTYSGGVLKGSSVEFELLVSALVCNPIAGQRLKIRVLSNIASSGIRGVSADPASSASSSSSASASSSSSSSSSASPEASPYICYVYKDHHYNDESFSAIKEGDLVDVEVICTEYELLDPEITVVGILSSIYLK